MNDECPQPIELEVLLAYQRGELDDSADDSLEEHLFACRQCSERLTWIQALEDGVNQAMRSGAFDVGITAKAIERLEREGRRLRHYRLDVGESVNCTISPTDDLTVFTLVAPRRPGLPAAVESRITNPGTGHTGIERVVAYPNQENGELTLALAGAGIRALPRLDYEVNVIFGEGSETERVGPFFLHHYPWQERGRAPSR